ncbi:MAG: hypothetical protein PWP51_2692 [Clostridiales bacterium]|jgi:hypothetical protein|nr:hypothetical protein [Clostridiales bacterium]
MTAKGIHMSLLHFVLQCIQTEFKTSMCFSVLLQSPLNDAMRGCFDSGCKAVNGH